MSFFIGRFLKSLGFTVLVIISVFVLMNILPTAENGDSTDRGNQLSEKTEEFETAPPDTKLYQVVKVIDGDTIRVQIDGEQVKVRLIGIDAPEISEASEEIYGKLSLDFLKALLNQNKVSLILDIDPEDRYGRTLAYVYTEDGTFVNANIMKEGYARVMSVPPNTKYETLFSELEKRARNSRKGLWGIDRYRFENPPH